MFAQIQNLYGAISEACILALLLTLTATTWPSWQPVIAAPLALSAALWICPMLPLATGSSSIESNSSGRLIPNALSRILFVCLNRWAGAFV